MSADTSAMDMTGGVLVLADYCGVSPTAWAWGDDLDEAARMNDIDPAMPVVRISTALRDWLDAGCDGIDVPDMGDDRWLDHIEATS